MSALLVHTHGLSDIVLALQLGWGGIEILHARTQSQALRLLDRLAPDIVVIEMDSCGLEVARKVRCRSEAVIVAVSSRYEESELIAAVDAGCDDYLRVTVSPATFVARVRAALRRMGHPASVSHQPSDVARCGNLVLDSARYEARVRGRPLRLTAKEFELLLHLALKSGEVSRHEALSKLIWGDDSDLYAPWLRKYIQHLRQKLAETPRSDVSIVTVPRVGYKLVNGGSGRRPR